MTNVRPTGRLAAAFLCVSAIALCTTSCLTDDVVEPEDPVEVRIGVPAVQMRVGQSIPLIATVLNTPNRRVTWTSTNDAVARVDTAGVVTAVGTGTATITATAVADARARASTVVTVIPPVEVAVAPAQRFLGEGSTAQFTATVSGTTNQTVTWRSSNAAVAEVNTAGIVTGRGAGTATITAVSSEDTTSRGTATVTVLALDVVTITDLLDRAVDTTAVRDTIVVTVEGRPAGTSFTGTVLTIDGGNAKQCVTVDPARPHRVACTVDTAALTDNQIAVFRNGAHTMRAQFVAGFGELIFSRERTLTFANRNRIGLQASGPLSGPGGLLARGSDLTVTARPIVYDDFVIDTISVSATSTTGGINASFAGGRGAPPGVAMELDTIAPRPQSEQRITVTRVASAGTDLLGQFLATSLDVKIDLVPPVITVTMQPPPTINARFNAVVLDVTLSSEFAQGDTIALARITGGSVSGPQGGCSSNHLRSGSAGIRIDGKGPFTLASPGPCHFGRIVEALAPKVTLRLAGSVTDPNLDRASLTIAEAVGACDTAPGGDDIALTVGTGPGQVSGQGINLSAGFDVTFDVIRLATPRPQGICLRASAADAVVGNDGQPRPNTSTAVFLTTISW